MAEKLYERFEDVDDAEYTLTTAEKIAMTFTVGNTGTNESHVLSRIELHLIKIGTNTGVATIEICEVDGDGKPAGVLATATIADVSTISASGEWKQISNFDRLATLNAGTQYAITWNHDGTNGSNFIGWQMKAMSGATYTGGRAWGTADNGATWGNTTNNNWGSNCDFCFRIYGEKWGSNVCSYENYIDKVGANANATAKTPLVASRFVALAEAIVNTRTQKNWSEAYASANTNFKKMLSAAVACWASVDGINYDMSGYDSRLEAEGMKRTNMLQAELLIQEIKDSDIQGVIINGA
jgi:hypothetical protein